MILFFDTETTGLVDTKMPADWPGQPHLVQLGAVLAEDDGLERSVVSLIVCPGLNVHIPEAASNVHGITDEVARRCGVNPMAALGLFYRLAQQADLLVAHHLDFDLILMQAEAHRADQEQIAEHLGKCTTLCTVDAATPVVDLPPTDRMLAAGFDKPKPPKLEECIRHFFDEDLEGAHDALVDVRACKRVFFKLKEMEKV